jgi:hypothetical protein
MKKIEVSIADGFSADSNSDIIAAFVRKEFPEVLNEQPESILDGVMAEMIGTRQVRLAGRPTPESEVAMRDVVRKCVQQGHPIPVLVVSDPKKPIIGESIDIAELSALKMLECLNRRVKVYFPPGITVRIRLEDSTGCYLEEGVVGLHETMERYIGDFCTLTRVLGYDFIEPVREQTLMSAEQLRIAADKIFPLLMAYLVESDPLPDDQWQSLGSWKQLAEIGWQGSIPREMRKYYHERYQNLFPEYDESKRLAVTAKYLAGTLARYQLKATGVASSWPGFFQINFAPPVPGIPESLVSTRLYYRTVPLGHTRRHLPFWRAKGFLKLNGETRISLASWSEPLDFNRFAISFSNGEETVIVRSDYVETED